MIGGRILCRADAGRDMGFGHVLRCVNLLEQMPIDEAPILLMRRGDGFDTVAEARRAAGWTVIGIAEHADLSADIDATIGACEEHDVRVVITDLCHREMLEAGDRLPTYHRGVRARERRTLVSIEDCRCKELTSDIAVIPYECGATSWSADSACTVLSGFRYAVLSASVAQAAARPRTIRETADRVLICIGGGDPLWLSLTVTQALAALGERQPRLRVLLGPGVGRSTREQISAICRSMRDATIHDFGAAYTDLLFWADVLVCGEGLMRFDAAATGTPALVITQFDHDSDLVRHYLSLGVADLMGTAQTLSHDHIGESVRSLLSDRNRRAEQSRLGKALIDGRGPQRIFDALPEHVLAGAA